MSANGTVLGPNALVFLAPILASNTPPAPINGTVFPFAVIEGTYRDTADLPETTDSFNTGKKHVKSGLTQFSADIVAQLATDQLPDSILYLIQAGNCIHLDIYPYGTSGGAQPYAVLYFYLEEWECNFRSKSSEPQTIRFRGRSSGDYSTPNAVLGSNYCGVNFGPGT